MMSNEKIVDIRSRQPHMTGGALCLNCKWEWVAVAEVGVISLDCPECGTGKGVWKGVSMPVDNEMWECRCGCNHFFITRGYFHCCHCGREHSFGENEHE